MKKIKKIVLKSATELTTCEMKKLRGGYDPEKDYPPSCIVQCTVISASLNCVEYFPSGTYCAPISGAGILGVGCFLPYDDFPYEKRFCQEPEIK